MTVSSAYLFFFFQAEDGIRDVAVTGVQTCALPISFALGQGDESQPGEQIEGEQRAEQIGPVGVEAFAGQVVEAESELCRSEEHTSELQSRLHLVCRLLLEKKKKYRVQRQEQATSEE